MSSAETIRLFIALPVPGDIQEKLRHAQAQVRSRLHSDTVRWVRSEQIHLTLKFLGDVPVVCTNELFASVRTACVSVPPLQLSSSKIGFFPNARRPRVVWAGVACQSHALEQLQTKIEKATVSFAEVQKDQRFSAHLTIGRIKEIHPRDARALEEAVSDFAKTTFGNWTANTIEIMRSELGPGGSRYSRVAEIPFSS